MEEDKLSDVAEKGKKLTIEEVRTLRQRVEELRHSNAFLVMENDTFERFISRLDLQDMEPQTTGRNLGRMGPSQAKVVELNLNQKCHLVEREVEATREGLEKLKHHSERIREKYKAVLEEADICLAEIQRAECEFEEDIIKPLRDRSGVMMGADKVLRYIEDKRKAKDTQVERLCLENQRLKAHGRTLQLQWQQREDMEETLNEVEYQHLSVKNCQAREQIETCYEELLGLKQQAAAGQQVLNSYQKRLRSETCEAERLSGETGQMEEMLVKLAGETRQFEEERSKAEHLHQRLCSQLAGYHVCDVLDYVKVKEKHKRLQCSFKALARKVEIAEMDLKTNDRARNNQGTSDTAADNTEAGPCYGTFNNLNILPDIGQVAWHSHGRKGLK